MEERKLGMQITVLPQGTTAKQALEMVYRGEIVLTPQQMRAAIECLQFEVPKVSAVGVAHLNENDFASALDRAIERFEKQFGPPGRHPMSWQRSEETVLDFCKLVR